MTYRVDFQFVSKEKNIPKKSEFKLWITEALQEHTPSAEVTIRVVDSEESSNLNQTYRKKAGPTYVLAFPGYSHEKQTILFLGDLVLCAPLVEKEAKEQGKTVLSHWANLTIHGTLHLLGFDHDDDKSATAMEAFETDIMKRLGFKDPYEEQK